MRTPTVQIANVIPFGAVACLIAWAAGRASTQADPHTFELLLAVAVWCLAVVVAIAGSIDVRRARAREMAAGAARARAVRERTAEGQWAAIVRSVNPDDEARPKGLSG